MINLNIYLKLFRHCRWQVVKVYSLSVKIILLQGQEDLICLVCDIQELMHLESLCLVSITCDLVYGCLGSQLQFDKFVQHEITIDLYLVIVNLRHVFGWPVVLHVTIETHECPIWMPIVLSNLTMMSITKDPNCFVLTLQLIHVVL